MKTDTAKRKAELRAAVRERRRSLTPEQLGEARSALTHQLKQLVARLKPTCITCFMPQQGEPDTTEFIDWALAQGIDVLLPSSQPDGRLDWVQMNERAMVSGAFGISEPAGEALGTLAAERAQLLLIPAASVDVTGRRLGWGKGYFDRTLAQLSSSPEVYAVVHDHELVAELPSEPHDKPVHGVVTPQRTLRLGESAALK